MQKYLCICIFTACSLLSNMPHLFAAESELTEYTLSDGRVLVGKLDGSAPDGRLILKLWLKDKFVGALRVTLAEIKSEKPYRKKEALVVRDQEELRAKVPDIYRITMKNERVIVGVPGDSINGKITVKLWFKGRFMGTTTIQENDIFLKEIMASEEVGLKKDKSEDEMLAEEDQTEEARFERMLKYKQDTKEKFQDIQIKYSSSNVSREVYSAENLARSIERNYQSESSMKSNDSWRVKEYNSRTQKYHSGGLSSSAKYVLKQREEYKDKRKDQLKIIGKMESAYGKAIYAYKKYLKATELVKQPVDPNLKRQYDEIVRKNLEIEAAEKQLKKRK